jgi:hypothetical protein
MTKLGGGKVIYLGDLYGTAAETYLRVSGLISTSTTERLVDAELTLGASRVFGNAQIANA